MVRNTAQQARERELRRSAAAARRWRRPCRRLQRAMLCRLAGEQRNDVDERAFTRRVRDDAALRSLLRAEVALGMAGLRFPVGGSRVVVARRPA
jgi:hypothetical protein